MLDILKAAFVRLAANIIYSVIRVVGKVSLNILITLLSQGGRNRMNWLWHVREHETVRPMTGLVFALLFGVLALSLWAGIVFGWSGKPVGTTTLFGYAITGEGVDLMLDIGLWCGMVVAGFWIWYVRHINYRLNTPPAYFEEAEKPFSRLKKFS